MRRRSRSDLTPESPEVQKLVDAGLAYLETHTDNRLGGKCLIALAFLKAGQGGPSANPRGPRGVSQEDESQSARDAELDMYSNGLAIIFLCEAVAAKVCPRNRMVSRAA